MKLRDRLIKGTAMNIIAVAFNQGSTLLVNIVIARILGKQSFGEYAMVQSTLLSVATLSQLATGFTASKYIAEYRCSDPERAGRIMGLCALVSVAVASLGTILLVAMAPILAESMLKAPHLAFALVMGSGYLFFSAINGYQTGALSGLEAYGSLSIAGVASGVIAIASISLGAWWGGLDGTLIGLSISALARCAIHSWRLIMECRVQGIKPQYRGSLGREKSVIHNFALPAALSGFYSMPMLWLANAFLVRQPGGYGEMALYSAANNLRIIVLFLPSVINSVGLSVLNNEKAKGDIHHYNRVFKFNGFYILIASLCGIVAMGIFGPSMLRLFGKDFGAGHLILWLLLAASLFDGLNIALYQYLQSMEKIWLSFFSINVPREAFLVVASYFLVQPYGGIGLAVAYLASTVLGFIFHLLLVTILYRKESRSTGLYVAIQ